MFISVTPGHRFEDVPGMRRHLVRKSTKNQVVHIGKDHKEPTTRSRKQDRTPHEVRQHLAHWSRTEALKLMLLVSTAGGGSPAFIVKNSQQHEDKIK